MSRPVARRSLPERCWRAAAGDWFGRANRRMTAPAGQPRWRAGVIAAGRGERLQNGAPRLKPLVNVGGSTLIERVLGSLGEAFPSEVVVIVNDDSRAVRDHVASRSWPFNLRWIVETTPSSMHS